MDRGWARMGCNCISANSESAGDWGGNSRGTPAYTVQITGSSMTALTLLGETIAAGRRLAEEYGTTADRAVIYAADDNLVGMHERSRDGNGRDWYETEC